MTTESSAVNEAAENPALTDTQNEGAIAESPAAPEVADAKEPKSALEAVQDALKPESEVEAKEEKPTEQPEDQDKESESSPDDGEKEARFDKHPRFQELRAERDKWKQTAEQQKEIVQRFETFRSSILQAGLTAEDVDASLEIAALIRSNPQEALRRLAPVVNDLSQVTGYKLPQDLQQRVESGQIDEQSARELAHARYQANHANQQVQTTQYQWQQEQRRQMELAQQQAVTGIYNSLAQWENEWKSTDPDYQLKQPLVEAEVHRLKAERGSPRNAQEAMEMANEARKNIDERVGKFRPAPNSIRTVTGGNNPTGKSAAPKSALDAVRMAIGGK